MTALLLLILFGGLAVSMGAGAGVVLRLMWDALGISKGRSKRPESASSDPAAADPFADRFGSQRKSE